MQLFSAEATIALKILKSFFNPQKHEKTELRSFFGQLYDFFIK